MRYSFIFHRFLIWFLASSHCNFFIIEYICLELKEEEENDKHRARWRNFFLLRPSEVKSIVTNNNTYKNNNRKREYRDETIQ